jgi:DNA/RNA-binding domain of Phe-tRNA-synthetase-like protein
MKEGLTYSIVTGLLWAAEASIRERLNLDHLADAPRIAAWREAYRSAGIKPNEFRSSIEAMARRALRSQELPSINKLVDIGNILSLRHIVPAGAHALDEVAGDIALRKAAGDEEFVPFGSEAVEHPQPGEIVFVEGRTVLTRRWSWRQAVHTLTRPETTAVELNIDGLPPVSLAEIMTICEEAMELIRRFCGGRLRYEILTKLNPEMALRP